MSITIVIVDHDEGFLRFARQSFEAVEDITCLAYLQSGRHALMVVPALNPRVALISNSLPDLPGSDCARELRVLLPALRIVMVATSDGRHLLFEALMAGVGGYLMKPVPSGELTRAIRAAHRGEVPLCPASAEALAKFFQATPKCKPALSDREHQIMACMLDGLTNKEIAYNLRIGYGTVRVHMQHIFRKTQAHSRPQAIYNFLGPVAEGFKPATDRAGTNSA